MVLWYTFLLVLKLWSTGFPRRLLCKLQLVPLKSVTLSDQHGIFYLNSPYWSHTWLSIVQYAFFLRVAGPTVSRSDVPLASQAVLVLRCTLRRSRSRTAFLPLPLSLSCVLSHCFWPRTHVDGSKRAYNHHPAGRKSFKSVLHAATGSFPLNINQLLSVKAIP